MPRRRERPRPGSVGSTKFPADHADTDPSGLTTVFGSVDGDYALHFPTGTSYYPVTSYFDGFSTFFPLDGSLI